MNIDTQKKILEIGSGSGGTACHIAEKFGCHVTGIDQAEFLLKKAKEKAKAKKLEVTFLQSDAHTLPFQDDSFDIVLAECVMSLVDKEKVLKEIKRVLMPNGTLGLHDIYWQDSAPDELKERLFRLEHEKTETIEGWRTLLQQSGFTDIVMTEKPNLMKSWINGTKKQMGIWGQIAIFYKVIRKWGISGVLKILKTESIFTSKHLGYAIIQAKNKA